MTAAVLGLGTTLQVGNAASPEVFTTISEVLNMSGPNISAEDIDVTNFDSTAREYISGVADSGSVSFEVNYIGQTQQQTLRADVTAGTARNYRITWNNSPATVANFSARVMEFTPSTDPNSQNKASVTLKVSGSVTWTN